MCASPHMFSYVMRLVDRAEDIHFSVVSDAAGGFNDRGASRPPLQHATGQHQAMLNHWMSLMLTSYCVNFWVWLLLQLWACKHIAAAAVLLIV